MAIMKIKFESTVKNGKKKSVMEDSVRIHVADPGRAKELFNDWLNNNHIAIRGDSGIFHPLDCGTIAFKEAVPADAA